MDDSVRESGEILSAFENIWKRNIFVKCTEGVMLGKATNIMENNMSNMLSRKQSKKKSKRVGH